MRICVAAGLVIVQTQYNKVWTEADVKQIVERLNHGGEEIELPLKLEERPRTETDDLGILATDGLQMEFEL